MANLLNEALAGVSQLMPLQNITLKTLERVLVQGFTQSQISEVEAVAHIQPLTPFEVSKIGGGEVLSAKIGGGEVLSAKIAYKFYIRGDLANVLNSLSNKDTLIVWQGKEFQCYSKDDYSLNGWIKAIGVAVQNV